MQNLPKFDDPALLVGPEHLSDAGVYRISQGTAIVQTVDFFPPLVDDPYVYGQIAAANSLSDIYAMGGRPRTALNIVGFPDDKLPMSVLERILQGGAERVRTAGAVMLGGHSVRDVEIKYGLAVTGVADPAKLLQNTEAKPGDVLVLTKALGTSFIVGAERERRCPNDVLAAACESMVTLNASASEAAVACGAKAATDVTGFGLAGHAMELAMGSDVTIRLRLSALPLLPGAIDLAERGFLARANETNRSFVSQSATFEADSTSTLAEFLFDPQTSGGLLIAIAQDKADELVRRCREGGCLVAAVIGSVHEKGKTHLVLED